MNTRVAVVMGSDSDLPIVQRAIDILHRFGVPYTARVMSAHRTPDAAADFAKSARDDGFGVIIAAAGKAAHLGGVLAAYTTIPVIGLPIKSSTMDGLDSLLSMVQMPKGIPVATVAIDGAENAALLAISILALFDADLSLKLDAYRKQMSDEVTEKDAALQHQLSQ